MKCTKYFHCKLKSWQDEIKTNISDQLASDDMYGNAIAVLEIDSVYLKV